MQESADEESTVLMIWASKLDLCSPERKRAVPPDTAAQLAQVRNLSCIRILFELPSHVAICIYAYIHYCIASVSAKRTGDASPGPGLQFVELINAN